MDIRTLRQHGRLRVVRQHYAKYLVTPIAIALLLLDIGCAGITSAGSSNEPPPASIEVTITPSVAGVQINATQQFTAEVTGTDNKSVTWTTTSGTVSSNGLYTAPATAGTYTVTATSVADPGKSASAAVTITTSPPPVTVSITPTSTSVQTNATRQFRASVTGTTNTAVTWSATGGTVSSSGLYTAPATTGTYTLRATSVADSTKSATATVTVTSAPGTISVAITPTEATLQTGETRQFSATVSGTTNTGVTWSATGGNISRSGLYTAPSSAGTYTVTARSVADNSKSASATVTVSAATGNTFLLTASPTSLTFGNVLAGNTATLSVTLTNTGNSSVTLSAVNFTGGVFSSGITLPTTIAAGATRTVNIVFAPSISGPFSGNISFVSNASNSPATVSLSGTGIAALAHSVELSWVGSASTGVAGYYIYRGTVSGGPYGRLNSTPEATTTYTDSSVQSGLTYYYTVTAVDGSGAESTFSNESTAVIPIP